MFIVQVSTLWLLCYTDQVQATSLSCFDELNDMLAIYSSPLLIVGDFNVHVDDRADTSSAKLHDILVNHCLQQHVTPPTHVGGHILDLFITRDSQDIVMMPIDTPLHSDHSLVVGEVNCLTPANASVSRHQVRNWRTFDTDAFTAAHGTNCVSTTWRHWRLHVLQWHVKIIAG